MRFTDLLRYLTLVVLLAGTALLGSAIAADAKDEGFTDFFNGKDFTGWNTFIDPKAKDADPAKTWTIKDGIIICTGHPYGFFYTDKSYKDYVIVYDWRYKRPEALTNENAFKGNSGCLVHIHNPEQPVTGGVWPQCVEVQGMNLNHGMLIFLKTKGKGQFDREAKNRATHPVGQWNTTEITCKGDGSITAKINGTQVSSGRSDLTEGMIGFQSEGAEIHFRNIKIKQIK
jgi:hypothetical protein